MNGDLEKYIVDADSTIEDAWTKIESNRHRSVIVVKGNKIVGTLSDGDLRKAMLSKRLLSTPVRDIMNINFVSVKEDERDRAEEILKSHDIFLIPIVDEDLNLRDIIIK